MKKEIRWLFYDYLSDGDEIEFFDPIYKSYIKMNLENNSYDIRVFGLEYVYRPCQLLLLEKYQDKMIFVPGSLYYVLIYDKKDKKTQKLPLEADKFAHYTGFDKFCKVMVWKNKVYLYPRYAHSIVCIDMNTYDIKYLEDCFLDMKTHSKERVLSPNGIQKGQYAIFPCENTNKIFVYNLENDDFKFYNIKNAREGFSDIHIEEEAVWLTSNCEAKMYKWNYKDNTVSEYSLEESLTDGKIINRMIVHKEWSFFFPNGAKYIDVYDKRTMRFVKKIMLPSKETSDLKLPYFICIKAYKDKWLLGFSREMETLMKISMETGEIEEIVPDYPQKERSEILYRMLMDKPENITSENDWIDTKRYIEVIASMEPKKAQIMDEGISGDKYLLI